MNINALMSIAVTGALLLGQWPEAAMVMVLFTLAELIEARSLDRARNAIGGLLQSVPATASLQQADGSWQEVDVGTVTVGSLLRVKPGERVALDGWVEQGQSTVDQASITGESLPVEKRPGMRSLPVRSIRLVHFATGLAPPPTTPPSPVSSTPSAKRRETGRRHNALSTASPVSTRHWSWSWRCWWRFYRPYC
ncbi:Potassium-transporting ATPase ATP-binding subunit [Sodalis praecaptivus]